VPPIRVLYLHHVTQLSGAENSLLLLLRHLDRGQVTPLFALPSAGPFSEALEREGIPVLRIPFGPLRDFMGVLKSVRRLLTLIRDHRIDLLHANGPQTNVCAGIAGRLTGVPAVWHARNLIYGRMWDVDRALARLAARIICNSDAIRERFRGSPAWEKSVTILNAVNTREFHPGQSGGPFRREMGVPHDVTVVGIVGRIGLGKGHDVFVEAAIRVLTRGYATRFFVIGDTVFPEDAWRIDELRRRVKEAGFDDRIRFVGYRRDIPQIMRDLDVLVLASDAEPCGRVLFEAMASGTAVAATNTGGTPEIVRDGMEGILIPPRNPEALADAIGVLIDDPRLREELGRNGAARVLQEFAVDRYVARTLEVYEQAVSR
jgi:glycosyltransferase involved in cell wall biosynthesis